ncbi:Nephrocystin-3 [Stylophora pistillata]|uniref:Nephrocystin-3 n=2 Tax=Stylophora pistillata TaxID=50429 RepID=A0A2B4RJP5_STYPI|nr:Nephrocystin-3 [Stylophora pistillata]
MNEIVRVLSEGNGKRLVVITGLPGYGKSCLAQRIGHTMMEKGFQVIFLCLRQIRSVGKMSARILRALKANVGHGLMNNPRELALSHLKSLTTRTTLILDNAEDLICDQDSKEEFYSFVNHVAQFAGHVKCVITSRVDCPASCQTPRHSVKLLVIENDAAAKLLQERVQDNGCFLEDQQAKTIAQLCFKVPLILHAAAAYLEFFTPETLIQSLESHFGALDVANMKELSPELQMRGLLSECLQQLGADFEEDLFSLSVFPAAFSLEQAQRVCCSKSRLLTALLQLVKSSLVHRELDSNQYFVHQVIQLCCEEKAKTDKRLGACYSQAQARFVEYYLTLITQLHQGFLCKGDLKKSLCSFWAEEENIVQAIWCAAASVGTALPTRCAKILNEAVIFLAKVMKMAQFEQIYGVVLGATKGDLRLVADCLTCVGIKQIYSCECHRSCSVVTERAYRVLTRALEIYEQLNLTEGELVAQCYSKIGRCMAKNGNPSRALELSDKALEIREKKRHEEPLKYAACCNDRAVIQSSLNNHLDALTLREQALGAYLEQLGHHPFTGTLYNYLGNDCLALENFEKAVEYFTEALSIRKMFFGFYHQETARTYHDLGVAFKMKGDYARAMEQLNAAIAIQEKLCDVPHEKFKSLQVKREIYSCLNLTDSSAQELQEKLRQSQEEMAREKKVNNVRLEKIMDMANNNGAEFSTY